VERFCPKFQYIRGDFKVAPNDGGLEDGEAVIGSPRAMSAKPNGGWAESALSVRVIAKSLITKKLYITAAFIE
jgi:hypothetical protein